jgi:hypothetical protein
LRLFTERQVNWESLNNTLGKVYYDPKHAAGFGSVAKLVKTSKNKKSDVEEWLAGKNTYTMH